MDALKITPETTLAEGCRAAGHDVTTLSHYDDVDFGRFDVVHVHHLSYGAIRLASDGSDTPFLFTPHDTSHLNGLRFSTRTKLAMAYVIAAADATVSLSRREAERQRQFYPFCGDHHETIPNGIDSRRYSFRRINSGGKGRPWQLVFCGQLIPLKRVDVLLRAMTLLRHNVELTLAYQNPALEAELKILGHSLGIEDRVHFAGKLHPRELAALYQVSDVLVLPSRTEALPSVITEAMLCGLPFIATAVGGIPEQSAGFGHLLKTGSQEDIASSIGYVLDHYHRFRAASEAMSRYAEQTYSIDSMVRRHLDLYERVARYAPRRHRIWTRAVSPVVRTFARRWGTSGPPRVSQTAPNRAIATD